MFFLKLAFKNLFYKNNIGLISFSTYSTIIGIALGAFLIIIVDSFTNGFNNAIDEKLSNIDGHIRVINHYDKVTPIDTTVFKNHILSTGNYISNYALANNKNLYESIVLYGVNSNSLKSNFSLDKFIQKGSYEINNKNNIIIGSGLAQNLDLDINDKIVLFNYDEIFNHNLFKTNEFIVTGIIKSGFPEYDKILSFTSFKSAESFLTSTSSTYGKIINLKDKLQIDEVVNKLKDYYNPIYHSIETWRNRHFFLYKWLDAYYIPIYFVIFSLIVLSLLNIILSMKVLVNNKKNSIAILRTIGFSKFQICKLLTLQGMILSTIGLTIGSILSLLFLLAQHKFKFISLSSQVYFLDHLPVSINFNYILLVMIFIFIFSLIVSIFASFNTIKLSISKTLRYE